MDLLKAGPKKLLGQFRFRGGLGHQEQIEYPIEDILSNIKIEFMQKVYSTLDFWYKMNDDINKANELMGDIKIRLPNENMEEKLKDKADFIFKFKVNLYGRSWTYSFNN